MKGRVLISAAILTMGAAVPVWGDVLSMPSGLTSLEFVPVGNPGNAGELSGSGAGGYGPDRICRAVDYEYNIGKYEVTAGQYCEFLNKVAATDSYGLYETHMDYDAYPDYRGCNIKQSGSAGSYSYSVDPNWANRPVNYVSWGDAARFANWLHNGQPAGAQDLTTTEDGAYYLNGAVTDVALLGVTRQANWKWAITSEDEWYKAAYHKNDGVTGNYFDCPTSSDSMPSNDLMSPDPGNNANFLIPIGLIGGGVFGSDYTIGSPYYRTAVGEFENSNSPYGAFDQGGNVWEWDEAILYDNHRGVRGGSFGYYGNDLHASGRTFSGPTSEDNNIGFRISEVPEPSTLSLLALGGLGMLRRRHG